jgi:hypothetical protein
MSTPNSPAAFELASASVCGRDHQRVCRNNQDALAVERGARHLVLVVADGCGSSPGSEVGARLGARLLAAALLRRLEPGEAAPAGPLDAPPSGSAGWGGGPLVDAALAAARADVLAHLGTLARGLCAAPVPDDRLLAAAVKEHLLFTLVGAVVGPEETALFALGDGLLALNERSFPLGPFPGNQPPYLGYALLPQALHGFACEELQLEIRARLPTASLRSLALGTDGALDLGAAAAGPEALLGEPVLFKNPDGLRRRLYLLARDQPGRPAPLHDDTTLVLLRRAPVALQSALQPAPEAEPRTPGSHTFAAQPAAC